MAAWMFKGNPTIFDINAYLGSTNPITWTLGGPVKRFDRIQCGDRIFMFRSDDGVVAVGRALGGPQPQGRLDDRVRAMWFRFAPRPDKPCVPVESEEIRLHVVDGMVPIRDLRQHPVLAGLSILKPVIGTTFAVTEEQGRALMDLWRTRAR